jgi:class 3 adenylate cyclase
MNETRKLAAILAAGVVGFSRLAGADEDRTLARLRVLRSDLIDPTIAVHNGRVVKRTGDGPLECSPLLFGDAARQLIGRIEGCSNDQRLLGHPPAFEPGACAPDSAMIVGRDNSTRAHLDISSWYLI